MAYPAWPEGGADRLELQLLETWKEERLFHRTLEAGRNGEPFVFFEGPPTANGRPGIHHVFSRTIKDLICRFHAMQGQAVTRIAGWDTHGLPDGRYRIRVTASDQGGNALGEEATASVVSPAFVVDNTAPLVLIRSR